MQTDNATPIVPITSDARLASAATSARDRPAAAAAPATYVENISYKLSTLKFYIQQVKSDHRNFWLVPSQFYWDGGLAQKREKIILQNIDSLQEGETS